MASLKVRTTFEKSLEAFALNTVGCTPSTFLVGRGGHRGVGEDGVETGVRG